MSYTDDLAAYAEQFGEAKASIIIGQVERGLCSEESAARYMRDQVRAAGLSKEEVAAQRDAAMGFVKRAYEDGQLTGEMNPLRVIEAMAMAKTGPR